MLGATIIIGALLGAAPIVSAPVSLIPDFDRVLSEPLALAPEVPDHRGRWTLIGALSGAALGVGIGFINLDGKSALASQHRDVFVGALAGGAIGALVGYLLAPRPPPRAPALLTPPLPERPKLEPAAASPTAKPPPPYKTGWLVAGIAGAAVGTIPIAILSQRTCPNQPAEKPLSPAIAAVIPVFWMGIGALIGNGAAHDNDAAKVGVVLFDTLFTLGGVGTIVAAGAACG